MFKVETFHFYLQYFLNGLCLIFNGPIRSFHGAGRRLVKADMSSSRVVVESWNSPQAENLVAKKGSYCRCGIYANVIPANAVAVMSGRRK